MDENFRFYVKYVEEGDLEYVNELTPTISYSDGIGMFSGCTSLEEVKLPKDLLAIPSRFVEGCTSLKTLKIPKSVRNLYKTSKIRTPSGFLIYIKKKIPYFFNFPLDKGKFLSYSVLTHITHLENK